MELISLVNKHIEGAYLSGNVLVVKLSDGRCLIVESKIQNERPILEVILNE